MPLSMVVNLGLLMAGANTQSMERLGPVQPKHDDVRRTEVGLIEVHVNGTALRFPLDEAIKHAAKRAAKAGEAT